MAATIAFNHTLVLPLVEPVGAGIAALAAMVGYRLISTDKDRRLLQKSFAYYLAPRRHRENAGVEQTAAARR